MVSRIGLLFEASVKGTVVGLRNQSEAMSLTVEKLAAVCFLHAVKLVVEQLAERRMRSDFDDAVQGQELTDCYHRARRLRDHLQRRAGAFQDTVSIDLDREDRALLVACCRHFVQHLEARLEQPGNALSPNDRNWIQHRSEVVSKWAVELAEAPACELPLPRLIEGKSPNFRGMEAMLQAKFARTPAGARSSSATAPKAPTASGPPQPVPGLRLVASGLAAPSAAAAAPAELPMRKEALAEVRCLLAQAPQQLRDPRLRAAMSLDLRSYRRSHASGDLRTAALLLTILLETAIVDHALVRGEELGLCKSPEGWSFLDLLKAALGSQVTPSSSLIAQKLVAARNLSRPAMQLVVPNAVTSASLDSMEDFVCQLLRNMGFSEQEQQPEVPGADEPQHLRGDGLDRFL